MRIKKILPFILLVFLFISCEKEDFEIETNNQRTVFMYLPWSTNLTSYFYNNISDMEEAIQEKGLENERIIVFLSTSPSESEMFKIKLPDAILNQCISLLKILNLRFGAIDFILDKNGNYIFLEINPNGQWAWIEKQTGYKISNEITNLLEYECF